MRPICLNDMVYITTCRKKKSSVSMCTHLTGSDDTRKISKVATNIGRGKTGYMIYYTTRVLAYVDGLKESQLSWCKVEGLPVQFAWHNHSFSASLLLVVALPLLNDLIAQTNNMLATVVF